MKDITLAALKSERPDLVSAIASEAQEKKEPPATVAELKAAFRGEDGFILGCVEKQHTMVQAKLAHGEIVTARLSALEAEHKQLAEKHGKLEKEHADLKARRERGVSPLAIETGEDPGDGEPKNFEEAVTQCAAEIQAVEKCGTPRAMRLAHGRAASKYPKLFQAWKEEQAASKK